MRIEGRIVIVGAGGHGKVVADALLKVQADVGLCFADDKATLHGTSLLGKPIVGAPGDAIIASDWFHLAIGHNAYRAAAYAALSLGKARILTIIHPGAHLSAFAELGQGVFLAAACVVAPSAKIGDGVIVNHGAVVDHDCVVDAFAHIAPAASLSGGVHVGAGALIGTGARVLPGLKIGRDAVIAAGAVVTRHVAPGECVLGVPARSKQRDKNAKEA